MEPSEGTAAAAAAPSSASSTGGKGFLFLNYFLFVSFMLRHRSSARLITFSLGRIAHASNAMAKWGEGEDPGNI